MEIFLRKRFSSVLLVYNYCINFDNSKILNKSEKSKNVFKTKGRIIVFEKNIPDSKSIMEQHKKENLYIFFAVIIFVAALVLRIYNIEYSRLWIDELYCFDIANKSNVVEVLKTVFASDLHAPLFFVILHYWMKIFSSSDKILLMLPAAASTASVAAGYFVCAKAFNKKTGLIFSILTAFSALEIFYAQELKFYAFLPLLSILSFYFFSKITDKFTLKDAIWLGIINLLVIYTFNIGIIFAVLQFITGLVFIFYKNKPILKNYLAGFIPVFVLYMPYFLFQLKVYLAAKSGICSIFDMFHFDFCFIFTALQDFFTPVLKNIGNNGYYYDIFSEIKNLGFFKFVIYIAFFLCINLYGIYRSIITRNQKNLLLVIWIVSSTIILMLLAYLQIIPLVVRYIIILHSLALAAVSFGLSQINNKILPAIMLCIVVFSMHYFCTSPKSPLLKDSSYHFDSAYILKINNEKINKNDYILMPYMGRFLYKYLPDGNHIDFRLEEILCSSDYPLIKQTFALTEGQMKMKNKRDIKLQNYIKSQNPTDTLEKYFVDNYISKMNKGDRIIFIENYLGYIIADEYYPVWTNIVNADDKNLSEKEKRYRFCIIYTKIFNDIFKILLKHLAPVKMYDGTKMDTKIFIFQKV